MNSVTTWEIQSIALRYGFGRQLDFKLSLSPDLFQLQFPHLKSVQFNI